MDRHWTLHLVALCGLLAGALMLVAEGAVVQAGVVTAASASALLLPTVVDYRQTRKRPA